MRAILQWLLILVIAAALATWAAWLFRDDLVAAGLLPGPPPDRVEVPPRPLPPIQPKVSTSEVPESNATSTFIAVRNSLGESDPPPGPRLDDAARSGVPADVLDCVVAGSFNDRETAAVVQERIRAAGADADVEELTVDAEPYYLVYVEPAISRDEARRTLLALQSQGIEDIAVIQTGERANGVSVGRFTSHEFATARLERLTALGYEMNLLAIDRDQTVYRVRIRNASADALAGLAYVACDEDA